ncbi:MAG: CBS domain-containing protein [Thermodesulfobacteria bacterium]|nr:CBS domain-containing protein [Thermodesulfobacteriota bacterium]
MKQKVLDFGTADVKTIPARSNIMHALKLMINYNFRRMPVADAGTKRLMGIFTTTDLINFFGGGQKHNIVKNRFNGNLAAAINEHVDEIMEKDTITLKSDTSVKDAIELFFEKKIGGAPIVDNENRVIGIFTERDLLKFLKENVQIDGPVRNFMTTSVITISPDTSIKEAMQIMIKNKIRRLPVVEDHTLLGVITTREIVRYFGTGEAFRFLQSGDIEDTIKEPVRVLLESEEIMKYRPLVTVDIRASISDVVDRMLFERTGVVLVVRKKRLEGIITERDLITFLHQKL